MKKLILLIVLLGLMGMACQLTSNAVDATGTPRATLMLPTTIPEAPDAASPTPTLAVTAVPPESTPPAAATAAAATPTSASAAASPTICPVKVEWPEYWVQPGDTMYGIAQRAGSTVAELVAANCLGDGSRIFVGQPLRVPPSMIEVMPTVISDGTDLVIYPEGECFSAPFFRDAGVSLQERWRTKTSLEVVTLFGGATSVTPSGLLERGEHFIVREGPVCYTKKFGSLQIDFRRWRVASESRPLQGWIDEYDPFVEEHIVEPRPTVLKFEVSPRVINSGDPITIEWDVAGANEVYLWQYHSLLRFASGMVTDAPSLPPSGMITVTAPAPLTSIQYSIFFTPEDGDHWATVNINCREPFFVEVGELSACPAGPPQVVGAAYQPFEHGFMVWHSDKIWVFLEDVPGSNSVPDTWDGEAIAFDEEPPAGMFQPVRGFGKVWVEKAWIRDGLGWATAAEVGYQMELQTTQIAFASYGYFFSLPDGRVVKALQYQGISIAWEFTSRR